MDVVSELVSPEVTHTEFGETILKNFLFNVCDCAGDWSMGSFVDEQVAAIREKVGSDKVICGLSGGWTSVVAALLHKAIGDRLPVSLWTRVSSVRMSGERGRRIFRVPTRCGRCGGLFLSGSKA